jgi:hypothetical protein
VTLRADLFDVYACTMARVAHDTDPALVMTTSDYITVVGRGTTTLDNHDPCKDDPALRNKQGLPADCPRYAQNSYFKSSISLGDARSLGTFKPPTACWDWVLEASSRSFRNRTPSRQEVSLSLDSTSHFTDCGDLSTDLSFPRDCHVLPERIE